MNNDHIHHQHNNNQQQQLNNQYFNNNSSNRNANNGGEEGRTHSSTTGNEGLYTNNNAQQSLFYQQVHPSSLGLINPSSPPTTIPHNNLEYQYFNQTQPHHHSYASASGFYYFPPQQTQQFINNTTTSNINNNANLNSDLFSSEYQANNLMQNEYMYNNSNINNLENYQQISQMPFAIYNDMNLMQESYQQQPLEKENGQRNLVNDLLDIRINNLLSANDYNVTSSTTDTKACVKQQEETALTNAGKRKFDKVTDLKKSSNSSSTSSSSSNNATIIEPMIENIVSSMSNTYTHFGNSFLGISQQQQQESMLSSSHAHLGSLSEKENSIKDLHLSNINSQANNNNTNSDNNPVQQTVLKNKLENSKDQQQQQQFYMDGHNSNSRPQTPNNSNKPSYLEVLTKKGAPQLSTKGSGAAKLKINIPKSSSNNNSEQLNEINFSSSQDFGGYNNSSNSSSSSSPVIKQKFYSSTGGVGGTGTKLGQQKKNPSSSNASSNSSSKTGSAKSSPIHLINNNANANNNESKFSKISNNNNKGKFCISNKSISNPNSSSSTGIFEKLISNDDNANNSEYENEIESELESNKNKIKNINNNKTSSTLNGIEAINITNNNIPPHSSSLLYSENNKKSISNSSSSGKSFNSSSNSNRGPNPSNSINNKESKFSKIRYANTISNKDGRSSSFNNSNQGRHRGRIYTLINLYIMSHLISAFYWLWSLLLDVITLSWSLSLNLFEDFLNWWKNNGSPFINKNIKKIKSKFNYNLTFTNFKSSSKYLLTSFYNKFLYIITFGFKKSPNNENNCQQNTKSANDKKNIESEAAELLSLLGPDKNILLPSNGDEAMRRLFSVKGQDPYSILGVRSDCNDDTIRRYYKKQAVLVHPDKNLVPGAEEAFKILARAFELIGEPVKRMEYHRQLLEAHTKEKIFGEIGNLLEQLRKKMESVTNSIRCTKCNSRHKKNKTDRPVFAARYCSQCKIHHGAREGDLWAEKIGIFGFFSYWQYYACMECTIWEINEWAKCQKKNLRHLKPNSHNVQYRLVAGNNTNNNNKENEESFGSCGGGFENGEPHIDNNWDNIINNLYNYRSNNSSAKNPATSSSNPNSASTSQGTSSSCSASTSRKRNKGKRVK